VSAAAPTPDPQPPATPPAGITREEFEQLQKRLNEFTEAAERLSSADTAAEEQRREREAREAATRVEQTAQRIGLSPADVGEIRGWIRAETKEAVREALDEIAEVRREDGEGAPGADEGGQPAASTLADLADDPTRKPGAPAVTPSSPPAPTPPVEPETPPVREHWFHRPLGGKDTPDGDK
jgi:hypothetical protein